jgi:hypothetical protein
MEGFSSSTYHNFITNTIPQSRREKITRIILSSRSTIINSEIADRLDSDLPIEGKPKIDFRPKISVLSFLKQTYKETYEKSFQDLSGPVPDRYGDLSSVNSNASSVNIKMISIGNLNTNELFRYMEHNIKFLRSNFPNAVLYIVFPSGYYDNKDLHRIKNSMNSVSNMIDRLSHKQIKTNAIYYIVQPPFQARKDLSDTAWHASPDGRQWRTADLIKQINLVSKKNQ